MREQDQQERRHVDWFNVVAYLLVLLFVIAFWSTVFGVGHWLSTLNA